MLIYLYTIKKSNAVCWKGAEKMNARKMIRAVILGIAASRRCLFQAAAMGIKHRTRGCAERKSTDAEDQKAGETCGRDCFRLSAL